MEKASTRIPKLTFGFRRSAKTNGTISEGNSPRGGPTLEPPRSVTPSGVKSAPGSNNTSPNLSRSKSLRVPRSSLKTRSNTSLLETSQEQDELGSHSSPSLQNSSGDSLESSPAPSSGAGRSLEPKSFMRPRSKTIGSGMRRKMNRNSRSMSPTLAEEIVRSNGEVEVKERDGCGLRCL